MDLEYLDSERKKLWERVSDLEKRLEELKSETEPEANGASRKTSEYRNKAKASAEEAARLQGEIGAAAEKFTALGTKASEDAASLRKLIGAFKEEHANVLVLNTGAKEAHEEIAGSLEAAEETRESLERTTAQIDETSKALTKVQELQKKLELQFKNSSDVADEIKDLSTEIFGYEEENDDGEKKKVDGLKDKLEKSYNDLSKKAVSLGDQITQSINNTDLRLAALLNEWSEKHEILNKRIQDLLPRALTAGLSHAYFTKKEDEISEGKRIARAFYVAIFGLILISLIPFGVAVHAVFEGMSIQDAIARTPRLVLAIFPLYIPVIWVAHSANRRANLSKRLVEEYSHKEVLAKTYEGLAKQISELPSETSLELRTKLLYNILEISSENPGKLISDYNKSDHPLMDALDKSVQLTNAVEKLARIPGFAKVAAQMQKKAEQILKEENVKAAAGLDALKVAKDA